MNTDLYGFRLQKDEFFREHPESPLTHHQRHTFEGLKYFDENPALRFELQLDEDVPHDELSIQTSTGSEQKLRRAGIFHIEVDGQPVDITAYGDPSEDALFIPFRDATSGKESYGAGRYLEAERSGEQWIVDFNYAYNPYCAYNEQWTCPLPPGENWLRVPIRAGEKAFNH